MTKKFFIIATILCVFVLAFTGCVKPPAEPAVPTISATDSAQDTRLAALEGQMANKMESASGTDIANRVTELEGQSAANTYTKAQLYTKAEIDELLRDKINEHIDISHTGSTTTTTTTTGDYGELLDSDGDLELWLERVSGDAGDELMTKKGDNDARFDLVVVNLDGGSSHDFKLNFRFDPKSAVTLAWEKGYPSTDNCTGTGACPFDDTLTEMTGTSALTFVMSRAGDNFYSLSPLVAYQSNTGRILKGDVEDYAVFLDVEQGTDAYIEWSWDITIDDKD